MLLPNTIQAVLQKRTIRVAKLCKFQFASQTLRLWDGWGKLQAGGDEWVGYGKFGNIDGLQNRTDLAADKLTFTLSGVDSNLITIAKQSAAEVKRRPCCVYLQFFDEQWQTLDNPIPIKTALMDQMSYSAVAGRRTITLTAEGIFAARGAAPFAYYTDRDQQARFPGDKGLQDIASLLYRVVVWPDF